MKKYISFLLFGVGFFGFSQLNMTSENNKWTFGGGVGFGFGSNSTFNLSIAPRAGYKLTEDIEVGASGTLFWQTSNAYKSTMVGIGPFANYYIARSFFLGASLQHYFVNTKDKVFDYNYNTNETALYLGGGYMQRLGGNAYLQMGLMYNVLWDENKSIFSNGLVPTVGFVYGL